MIELPTPQFPIFPRKKFRGRKRHFQSVERKASEFRLHPQGETGWWDFWHYHADWRGLGNMSWSYRMQYLKAYCQIFQEIAAASKDFRTPFQTWIALSGYNAGEDAVFLHTPNPNHSNFPLKLLMEERKFPRLEALVGEALPKFSFRFGLTTTKNEDFDPPTEFKSVIIYSPQVGIDLSDDKGV